MVVISAASIAFALAGPYNIVGAHRSSVPPAERGSLPRVTDTLFGADPTGLADSAAAFSNAARAVGPWQAVEVPNGTYRIDGGPINAQVTWIIGSNVTLTGAYPILPGRAIKLANGTALGTGGSIVGAASDWYEPQFATLTQSSYGKGRTSTAAAEFLALSHWGAIGLAGVSRTSDSPYGPGAMSTIGGYFGAINDNSTKPQWAYGLYVDALRKAGAGGVQAIETDIVNLGSTIDVTPNSMFPDGATLGYWNANGGGVQGAQDASVAYAIVNNGAKWRRGIVFDQNGLVGADGLVGRGEAISLGKGHFLRWYNAEGQTGAAIVGDVTDATKATGILFDDSGFKITNAHGMTILTVDGAGMPVLSVSAMANHVNDNAARRGGVPVGGVYRNGSVLMVRVE